MTHDQVINTCVQAMFAANGNDPVKFFSLFKKVSAAYGHTSGYACPNDVGANLNALLQAASTKAHPQFFENLLKHLNRFQKMDYQGGLADLIGGWFYIHSGKMLVDAALAK